MILGHYERFIDESLTKQSNVTTGKVYWSVLSKERRGDYGGGTVQVIPHITNELKSRFYRNDGCDETQIAIIEVGGTVGDIESQPFLEAIRQFQLDVGHENAILIHVTLIPYLKASSGIKNQTDTEPVLKNFREWESSRILLYAVLRFLWTKPSETKFPCSVMYQTAQVIQNLDVETLYEVPLAMEEGASCTDCLQMSSNLGLPETGSRRTGKTWFIPLRILNKEVTVAFVGKYTALHDAYISVVEVLETRWFCPQCPGKHQMGKFGRSNTGKCWLNFLGDVSGVLVPGGFGDRGIEGKITAIQYARENKIPFLGLCLGMQLAIVEFARNVVGWTDAHSAELDPCYHSSGHSPDA